MSKNHPTQPKAAQALPKQKPTRKKILTFVLILAVNVGIIAYMAIKEFASDAGQAKNVAMSEINMRYLIAAAGCFIVALFMETIKYESMLCFAEGRSDMRGAMQCAILGKYYDNITPLGAGGQPFQIYFLKKRGCSNGSAAALPIAGFLTLQLAFSAIAIAIFIANREIVNTVPVIRYSAYVGLLFYLCVPVSIVLFTIFPNSFSRLVCAIIRLLHRMHLVKDAEKTSASWLTTLEEYRTNLKFLSKIPHLLIKVFFYSFVYQVAILSIPFFVLRAFGGTSDWYSVFSLVVYIYAAITFIPTPGNAGAAEGSFYNVFMALTGGYLFWAVLIWRFLVYYIWLVLGMCLTGISSLHTKRAPKQAPVIPENPAAAQFVDVFYPSIDGVVRTVDSYCTRITKHADCCVICPRPVQPYADDFSYPVLRVPALRFFKAAYLLPLPFLSGKTRRYLKEHKFNVYHAHSPFLVGHFALRMGKRLGVPVVATFHSKYYDDILANTHSRFLARMVVNYIVKFYCKADAVWACSEGTAQTLRSYGFRGPITVVDNGIDSVRISDPDALRRQATEHFKLPQDKRLLLFVGHQIWQKNIRQVLDTAKLLKDRGGRYCTLLVGRGYHEAAIRDYTKSLGLQDDVLFFGQISNPDLLRGLYLASDLFFFPSIYDNAPLVLREAALMGLPALLISGSNAAEPVTDGFNGFTAEDDTQKLAEKIESIFEGGKLKTVSANAMRTIPVSWDEIVTRVQGLYRQTRPRAGLPPLALGNTPSDTTDDKKDAAI